MISKTISKHIIRSLSILTDTFVAGTTFIMDHYNFLGVEVSYTKGDETSLDMKIETSNDGTNWLQQTVEAPDNTGIVEVAPAQRQYTATGEFTTVVYPVRTKLIRISVKATGGTPSGSCSIVANSAWV